MDLRGSLCSGRAGCLSQYNEHRRCFELRVIVPVYKYNLKLVYMFVCYCFNNIAVRSDYYLLLPAHFKIVKNTSGSYAIEAERRIGFISLTNKLKVSLG